MALSHRNRRPQAPVWSKHKHSFAYQTRSEIQAHVNRGLGHLWSTKKEHIEIKRREVRLISITVGLGGGALNSRKFKKWGKVEEECCDFLGQSCSWTCRLYSFSLSFLISASSFYHVSLECVIVLGLVTSARASMSVSAAVLTREEKRRRAVIDSQHFLSWQRFCSFVVTFMKRTVKPKHFPWEGMQTEPLTPEGKIKWINALRVCLVIPGPLFLLLEDFLFVDHSSVFNWGKY